ncbi:MAG: chorismate mutase [Alphaproteobacteria bacterium]
MIVEKASTTHPQHAALLAPYRHQISAIDRELIELLAKRFAIIAQVAELKEKHHIPPILEDRVQEVLQKNALFALEKGLDPDLIKQLWRLIIDASCQMELDKIQSC